MPYQPPPRIADVLSMHRQSIIECIGVTVAESLESAIAANGGMPNEIWMLYSFFHRGLPALERRLNQVLGHTNIRVTISGILCHKNPIVEFEYQRAIPRQGRAIRIINHTVPAPKMETINGRCELADIAFLATYGGRMPGGGIGNALLAQTKMNIGDLGSNAHQTALYGEVRQFSYAAKAHSRARRELPPKHHPALWNWVLDEGHHGHPRQDNSFFGLPLHSELDSAWRGTAWAIYQLMAGVIGKGFGIPSGRDCSWNKIIFDLIRVTCRKTTKCKNVYAQTLQSLRGEEALQVVQGVLTTHGGQAIKNSFGRIFKSWGVDELALLGERLEKPKTQYTIEELLLNFDGGGPPEKKRVLEPGNEGEGSFVIFDLEDLEEHPVYSFPRRKRVLDF
jgi:hypothetical protein